MKGLDPTQISKLLGKPTNMQKHEIQAKITECMEKANEFFGNYHRPEFLRPEVTFDLRGTTAGTARGATDIRLNIELLHDYYDEMLEQTLPHEIAHCVVNQYYGGYAKSHGHEWAQVMRVFGIPPLRTHNMPTKKARVHPRPHIYVCPTCTRGFKLTNRMHNQVLSGRYRICPDCRTRLEYVNSEG